MKTRGEQFLSAFNDSKKNNDSKNSKGD